MLSRVRQQPPLVMLPSDAPVTASYLLARIATGVFPCRKALGRYRCSFNTIVVARSFADNHTDHSPMHAAYRRLVVYCVVVFPIAYQPSPRHTVCFCYYHSTRDAPGVTMAALYIFTRNTDPTTWQFCGIQRLSQRNTMTL